MRKFIFILLSIVVLVSCHTGEQDGDVLLNKNIKVFRYDRLQFEATAMNSFSALQKMSLDCPRATKILIEACAHAGYSRRAGYQRTLV